MTDKQNVVSLGRGGGSSSFLFLWTNKISRRASPAQAIQEGQLSNLVFVHLGDLDRASNQFGNFESLQPRERQLLPSLPNKRLQALLASAGASMVLAWWKIADRYRSRK